MSECPAIADPDAQMLARLAALEMAAAERAHERLMAAEDDKAFHDAGRTLQRLARSLRQTLALKAKLEREREQPPRAPADAAPPPKPGGAAIARRITELRQGVLRVIWDEAEAPEAADWQVQDLAAVITEEMLQDGFAAETLDDHVARVCLELGLDPERIARWRELPDPPAADGPGLDADPPAWRSSG